LLTFVLTFEQDSLEALSGEVRNHIRAFCGMAGRKTRGDRGADRGREDGH
jgi:hypothetical protein